MHCEVGQVDSPENFSVGYNRGSEEWSVGYDVSYLIVGSIGMGSLCMYRSLLLQLYKFLSVVGWFMRLAVLGRNNQVWLNLAPESGA